MNSTILDFSLPAGTLIGQLKNKNMSVIPWSKLVEMYEPAKHKIVNDHTGRKDKVRSDGVVDVASRIAIGLEKLLTKRFSEFTFSIPVKRVYHNIEENETRKEIAKAMEKIFSVAHINSENIKRGKYYYGASELLTVWYVVEKPNNMYGFESKYKLKCKTYSPMNGVELYPLFDEYDDMIAMSFEYKQNEGTENVTYFETYTAERHTKWRQVSAEWEVVIDDKITLMKIPAVYMYTFKPCYYELANIREELEYTLSRNSDTISYNAAPILKVAGGLSGSENKGETRRIYRVENGGDVSYVSWAQSIEALKYQVDMYLKLYFMQAQMPDISFDTMKNLGNIGYDARQTLLMDAHLRIGDEMGAWLEAFERETNVIKAFLKMMNVSWADEVDNIEVEHIITPFIQNDDKSRLQVISSATGGKPVMSQLEGIKEWGWSNDPDETYEQIKKEEAESVPQFLESAI